MASVFKPPQSKFWHAAFRDRKGIRRNRTTKILAKASLRKSAEAKAAEYEEIARGNMSAREVTRIKLQLLQQLQEASAEMVSFKTYSDRWLERRNTEVAAATMAFYRSAVKRFCNYLGDDRVSEDLVNIECDDIRRFRDELSADVSVKTANHYLKALRSLFGSAVKDNLLSENPASRVDQLSRSREAPSRARAFTVEELRTLLKVADGEWPGIIRLGLYTGQRLGDVVRLKWEQVDLKGKVLKLTTRKTGRPMVFPLVSPLKEVVEGLGKGSPKKGPLFPRASSVAEAGTNISPLSQEFANLLAKAGLREARVSHKREGAGRSSRRQRHELTFHSLRATTATMLHEAKVAPAVAQQLVGHESEEVHKEYLRFGMAPFSDAIGVLPVV